MNAEGIIEQVEAYAELHGVNIFLDYDAGAYNGYDVFHIGDLSRKDVSDPQSKGHGMKTLELLCVLADQVGAYVELEHMTDEPKLGELYSSLGFRIYDCGEAITNMRRAPQSSVAGSRQTLILSSP